MQLSYLSSSYKNGEAKNQNRILSRNNYKDVKMKASKRSKSKIFVCLTSYEMVRIVGGENGGSQNLLVRTSGNITPRSDTDKNTIQNMR